MFFHRGLLCLVAFELKVRKFAPEDLGKLSLYVEALDRDVMKPNERPSIGVLLCATKDHEEVEYALARTTSPTLVAEYQTMLPPKAVLRRKLHELYIQLAPDELAAEIRHEVLPHAAVKPVRRNPRPRKASSAKSLIDDVVDPELTDAPPPTLPTARSSTLCRSRTWRRPSDTARVAGGELQVGAG